MTDDQIIKALECCCFSGDCEHCPYDGRGESCKFKSTKDALDLITRQKAEIERLKGEMANISAKTLKQFEKNIKDMKVTLGQTWEIKNAIKLTLKEMAGEE